MTSKAFVRATQPMFSMRQSLETNMIVKNKKIMLTDGSTLEELNR